MIADDIPALIGLELLKTIKRPVIWMQAPMIFSMAKFMRSAEILSILFMEELCSKAWSIRLSSSSSGIKKYHLEIEEVSIVIESTINQETESDLIRSLSVFKSPIDLRKAGFTR